MLIIGCVSKQVTTLHKRGSTCCKRLNQLSDMSTALKTSVFKAVAVLYCGVYFARRKRCETPISALKRGRKCLILKELERIEASSS